MTLIDQWSSPAVSKGKHLLSPKPHQLTSYILFHDYSFTVHAHSLISCLEQILLPLAFGQNQSSHFCSPLL